MRTQSFRTLIGLLAVTAGAMAWAQQPPAAPAAGGVRLAYRFRPGAVTRHRVTMTGTMNMRMPGLGAGAGPAAGGIPGELAGSYDLVQTVKRVEADGSAVVTQTVEKMEIQNRMMGQNFVGKMVNGQMQFTMNGQPMPGQGGMGMVGGFVNAGNVEVRLAPTGSVLEMKTPLNPAVKAMGIQDAEQMFGSGAFGVGQLIFPAEPVTVGHQWRDQKTSRLSLPIPVGPDAGLDLQAETRTEQTLKEIRQAGTRRLAVITTRTETAVPRAERPAPPAPPAGDVPADRPAPPPGAAPGAPGLSFENLTDLMTGTVYFDITSGEIRTADFERKMAMDIRMGIPAAPGGGAPPAMRMEYTIHLKVGPPPSAPAATKPAKPRAAPRGKK